MLNLLKSFFGSRTYLGVDIGTTSVKIAEIERTLKGPRLLNYGILESYGHLTRLNEAIQTSSLNIEIKEAAEMLKALLAKSDFKTREVVASLPAFSAFITVLEIPGMSEVDTQKTLQFQIPQYIPLTPEEMNIDWVKIGETQDEKGLVKQQILLISVPSERVLRYREIFKLAGLRLKVLEVESLSLIRALAPRNETAVLIVDIGGRSTNIVIAKDGFLRQSIQTDFAGASLSQAVATGLGIDIKRAEEMKKQRGILVRAAEYELSTLTLPYLDVIISEVKRAKAAYEKNPESKIGQVILTGGGASLLGIEKYFEEQIGAKTVVGNPFSYMSYPPQIELIVKELGPTLTVAIGLGVRELI